uniref:Ty3 transposon capsid-like protein domain-containing protein n=1 Tax=Cyprinodon variegatus TaxID=28743 RepID=A0A3Q2EGQ2_CYPVA
MTEHCGQTQGPAEHLRQLLEERDAQIQRQVQTLSELNSRIDFQDHLVRNISSRLNNANITPSPQPFPGPVPPPRSPAVTSSEFRPSLPEKFSGKMKDCKGFLFQCCLIFMNSPGCFPTDQKKITFILSQLTGRALEWAQARFASDESLNCYFSDFISEFNQVFNQETDQAIDSRALFSLKQGNSSVADFSVNFRVKAAASGWNQSALKGAFFMALNEQIKDELATLDEPASLEDLIRLSIRLDNRIRARNSTKMQSNFSPSSLNVTVSSPSTEQMPTQRSKSQSLPLPVQASHSGERDFEPMQVGHTRL